MQRAVNPLELEAWVEVLQAETAGFISWHDAQNDGVDVSTIILYPKFINEKAWLETMETNLFAPALLSQRLVKKSKINDGASIVFISSIAASVASFGNISYMASKGAINSLARGMALELAAKKIRVNYIQPGLIRTNLTDKAMSQEDLDNYVQRFPLGRFGKPEEVAYSAIFLLSDATKWITGTSITVDGGVTLR